MSSWPDTVGTGFGRSRVLHKLALATLLLACLAWNGARTLASVWQPAAAAASTAVPPEWPSRWDGAPLRPLALGEVEQKFATQFPGTIARLTDGRQVLVMRHVTTPTRMLHPATDCYRALGYRIDQARLEHDTQQRLWRCFEARRPGAAPLRVCERIVDVQGNAFTDTSAWYWAAALGRSPGPWQAITIASTP